MIKEIETIVMLTDIIFEDKRYPEQLRFDAYRLKIAAEKAIIQMKCKHIQTRVESARDHNNWYKITTCCQCSKLISITTF